MINKLIWLGKKEELEFRRQKKGIEREIDAGLLENQLVE